ncbi:hypothetical protein SAMN04515671_0761 [Nakamurella panacisegetis]|uniref:Uncharacterized protein n=1 Tax=Nakamurella panacisegetis TaxID=1090615 RepID=A0A1H0J3A9_9ACTN|nr:hypothetical protein SAMN04515671_0761 [Nakamurella panacisegetis]
MSYTRPSALPYGDQTPPVPHHDPTAPVEPHPEALPVPVQPETRGRWGDRVRRIAAVVSAAHEARVPF